MRVAVDISVIICTVGGRLDELLITLDSLLKQTHLPNELVIVDASNDEEQERAVRAKLVGSNIVLKYIFSERGLTKQRNIGVKNSSGDILFFFDDDVTLDDDYIEQILATYERLEDPLLAGVQGVITNVYPHKGMSWLFRKIFSLQLATIGGDVIRIRCSGFSVRVIRPVTTVLTPVAYGGATSYKRFIFDTYAFDEALEGYALGEDAEFSYRVSREYKIAICPDARLEHRVANSQRINIQALSKMRVVNYLYISHFAP